MRLLVVCLFFCSSFAYGHSERKFKGKGGGTLFDSCNGFRSFTSNAKLTESDIYAKYELILDDKVSNEVVELRGYIYFKAAPASDRYQEWENDPHKEELYQYCEGNDGNDGACYADISLIDHYKKDELYFISKGAFWQPQHLNVFGKAKSASGCELTWMDVLETY